MSTPVIITEAIRSTATSPDRRSITTTWAVARDRFGSPDTLTLQHHQRPAIPAGHLLVEVHAAGVNRGDALEMRGWPYLARLMGYGIRRPKHPVLGTDIAGRVIAVSEDVEGVDIDDEVVGFGTGAFAEVTTIPASMTIRRPTGLDAEEAAALPTTGVTAVQAIRDAGRVEPGEHVAVIGASGGVGTFAVQIAKAAGAEVTAVAGGRNLELVRSIGADHVVDYRNDDISTHSERYDVIIDLVGDRPLRVLRYALKPTGTFVVVGGQHPRSLTGMRRFVAAAAMSPFGRQRLVPLFSKPDGTDLSTLVDLVEQGAVRPIVGRTFGLRDTADALRHIETGHGPGRTVITMPGADIGGRSVEGVTR
jgi:NADPH:quinone reductase-like Zn-dependent oxidoreductase